MNYRFLFPFEKIEKDSKIIIYGAGEVGLAYVEQMEITGYCEVVGVIDRNFELHKELKYPVFSVDKVNLYDFDYIVLAIKVETNLHAMKDCLNKLGVDDRKIVYVLERKTEFELYRRNEDCFEFELENYAYQRLGRSAVIKITGGIGDFIILKKFIYQFCEEFDGMIDIYVDKNYEFARFIYSDIDSVNCIVYDTGIRLERKKNNYTVAMIMAPIRGIYVEWLNMEDLEFIRTSLYQKLKQIYDNKEEYFVSYTQPLFIAQIRHMYKGQNVYTAWSLGGLFYIKDKKVNVPIKEVSDLTILELKKSRYITINYGNGIETKDIAKSWPKKYFEKLISYIKSKNDNIVIVQLGANGCEELKGVDKYILGRDFNYVSNVLREAFFHIDIEGGITHLASQIGTKCVVLFGPTSLEYYGYEQNINIRVGECRNCCGIYSEIYKCAQGMEYPECMWKIKPELVMEKIVQNFEL